MVEPANFINEVVDGLLVEWFENISRLSVEAIVVLGPEMMEPQGKVVLAVYPPRWLPAAKALTRGVAAPETSESTSASLVSWKRLSEYGTQAVEPEWVRKCLNMGVNGVLSVSFETVGARSFNCVVFCSQDQLEPAEQGVLIWSVLSVWPKVKSALLKTRSLLSTREIQCLELAFKGLTAVETAAALGCGDRTVNFHLSNAMAKLSAKNKLEAIQHACWLGVI